MAEFFDMGGYAQYVWPSYAAAAAILTGLTVYVVRRNAKMRAELARVEARRRGEAEAERRPNPRG